MCRVAPLESRNDVAASVAISSLTCALDVAQPNLGRGSSNVGGARMPRGLPEVGRQGKLPHKPTSSRRVLLFGKPQPIGESVAWGKFGMSYLTGPRLHFAGSFQADVSTVNNDVRHFDATTWEERFQSRQDEQGDNGWWNPTGSGAYRLLDCTVTGSAGSVAATDPVLNARILNAEDRPAAKLVDLDPQWQMASSIWGMTVRIVTPDGEELLRGAFEQAPFRDINFGRQLPNTPDVRRIQNGSAVFQSVLTDVVWGAGARTSPLLELLRTTTADGQLSIRLTTFGYYTDSTHDRFTLGSVVGAIGIYRADAPRSFTLQAVRARPEHGGANRFFRRSADQQWRGDRARS